MVCGTRKEEEGSFTICLCNNKLALESDKYTDTDTGTHIRTYTHSPDFFVLSGQRSCSYSSLTHRAVLVADREQWSCQQAQSLSSHTTHTPAQPHTRRYKQKSIRAHAVETCQTARLHCENTHKHTHSRSGGTH